MERRLCQDWLDQVADCVFTNDLVTWMNHFSLPLAILSDSESSTIQTPESLAGKFEVWKQMFALFGVTHLERTVRDVIHSRGDRIVASYDTDMLARGKRIMPRFDSVFVLELQGNRWRCTELVTGLRAAEKYLVHDTQTRGARAVD